MQELERALQQQGMSLPAFRERIRNSMITDSLINEFVRSRITLLTPEIEKYYKEHAADFTTPEEVTLSEIVIPVEGNPAEAEAKANTILKQLERGDAFATLASQHSKGPTAGKGGGIGSYLTATKLNPEIARAIANVKEGDVTGVLKTGEGYVIYRVDARTPATLKPLEQVRDEVRNRIWMQKFNPEYERFINQLKEEAYIQIFGEAK
jgi:parvulin-like peptidyl-prolyl isomerase